MRTLAASDSERLTKQQLLSDFLREKLATIQVKVNDKRKAELERITQAAANLKTLRNLFDEYAQNCQQKDGGKELQQSFKRDVFPIIDDY